jgi:hypothetical protein
MAPFRMLCTLGWITAGWKLATDDQALRALPYWGILVFAFRWVKLLQIPSWVAYTRHLPLKADDMVAHLWAAEWRALLIVGIEFAAVIGPWLQFHEYGVAGWFMAVPIAAVVVTATFASASAAFLFLGSRWLKPIGLTALGLGFFRLLGLFFQTTQSQSLFRILDGWLVWMSPVGWAVEAVRLIPVAPTESVLFLGATLAGACALPTLRQRIWNSALQHAIREPSLDADVELLDTEPSLSANVSFAPEDESKVRGEIDAALRVMAEENKALSLHALFTFHFLRTPTRWRLLYQLLDGAVPRWRTPLVGALVYFLGGMGFLFFVRSVVPSLGGLALALWCVGFAFLYLPTSGGWWPGLSASSSASRRIPYIALLPIGTWELASVMLISNYLRIVVFGGLAIPAVAVAATIFGYDVAGSALKAGIAIGALALLQPIAVTCQFLQSSRLSGCLNLLLIVLLAALVVALILILALVFLEGSHVLTKYSATVSAAFGILYVLSAIIMSRLSQRKLDLVVLR